MNIKAFVVVFVFSSAPAFAIEYDYQVTRVIDGDTIEFDAAFLPAPLKPLLSLRVLGVDTPETGRKAKCAQEAARGEAASAFTSSVIKNARRVTVDIQSWDKYGGRVLGNVLVDGVPLSDLLIRAGHARQYTGGARSGWCAP